MKKFLKILGIAILVLLVLIAMLPVVFRGKIMDIAKEQMNKNLNAKADFGKLSLSLFRSFPNVSVGLKDMYVAGIGEFEGDTLVSIKSVNIVLDLISAIGMENIKIKRIAIDNPRVHAWMKADGKVNWDIVKETGPEETDTSSGETNLKVELKSFEINHALIRYDDDSTKIKASLDDFNFLMSGDLSQDFSTLLLTSNAKFVNVIYGGIRYLKNAAMTLQMDVDADLKNSKYTLRDNSFALNDLVLKFDGTLGMPNDKDIVMDLKYGLDKADFKSLLSLIPAIYMKDYQDVQAAGKLKLDGMVKGTYNEKTMPDVGLTLLVENGMFKYPDLPKSATNIGIDVNLFYDGVQNDNTTVDINKFHMDLGGNPVDMTLNIKTPMSDMQINGNLKMNLDLATINDVIPLDSTTLTGKINAALDFMGFMSYIETEQYEKFKADGSLDIKGFTYKSPDLPRDLSINNASLSFSPKYVEVKSFDAIMGKSDFHLSGIAGRWTLTMATGWLMLLLTHSGFWIGAGMFAMQGPSLIGAPLSGYIADISDRRIMMTVSQVITAIALLALAVMVGQKVATPPSVLALSLLIGLAFSVQMTGWNALLPSLVPRERIFNAVALQSTAQRGAEFIGPALGSLIMTLWGLPWLFVLCAVAYARRRVPAARPAAQRPTPDTPARRRRERAPAQSAAGSAPRTARRCSCCCWSSASTAASRWPTWACCRSSPRWRCTVTATPTARCSPPLVSARWPPRCSAAGSATRAGRAPSTASPPS